MNTSYEYGSRGGSLIHTTPDGRRDVALPPTSRLYVISGHAHFDGPFPPERASGGQELQNPVNYYDLTVHALIDDMDAWVKKQTDPPPSRYPRIADGTLVPVERLAMKKAPPFAYAPYRFTSDAQPRDPQTGFGTDRVPFAGSLFPFDPATVAARYPSRELYLGRFAADSLQLIRDRYVAAEDVYTLLDIASRFWEWSAARPANAP